MRFRSFLATDFESLMCSASVFGRLTTGSAQAHHTVEGVAAATEADLQPEDTHPDEIHARDHHYQGLDDILDHPLHDKDPHMLSSETCHRTVDHARHSQLNGNE